MRLREREGLGVQWTWEKREKEERSIRLGLPPREWGAGRLYWDGADGLLQKFKKGLVLDLSMALGMLTIILLPLLLLSDLLGLDGVVWLLRAQWWSGVGYDLVLCG